MKVNVRTIPGMSQLYIQRQAYNVHMIKINKIQENIRKLKRQSVCTTSDRPAKYLLSQKKDPADSRVDELSIERHKNYWKNPLRKKVEYERLK